MYRFLNSLRDGARYSITLKTAAAGTKTVRRDYHPHFEVYFCPLEIKQDVLINGKPYVIEQPSVIISSPFSVHGMSKYNDFNSLFPRYTVYFNEDFIKDECHDNLPEGMFGNFASCIYLLTNELRDILKPIFDRMIDAGDNSAEFAAYFTAAMHTLDRTTPQEARILGGAKEYYYVVDVLRYIYGNKHKSLSADMIASEFHVSRAKLDRDFRAFVGQTLHKTVTDFRIGRAIELITSTKMKIRDVAAACGFEDEYYFYAFFKSATGMTPLAMRRVGTQRR